MSNPMFSQPRFRRKCLIAMGGLVLVNIVVWILAALAAKEHPSLLDAMVLAYTLGLRHGVNADCLAAIDNVTRKLMYQGSLEGLESWTPPVS
ncbi:hypothetical protein BGZ95_006693, partial [Linnemannia exigua]